MVTYSLLFVSAMAFIALRSFQQLNVQHSRYSWVPPVTLAMALCEVTTVSGIVKASSLWAAVPLAAGGVLGCWFGMWLHSKLREARRGN